MIDQITIDKIMDAADIVEVVSDFVSLRKRGVNYTGLCPFHDEKTPSFSVSPSKGICKCFSCGKGGNAAHFIMEHEQMSYYEALCALYKYLQDNIVGVINNNASVTEYYIQLVKDLNYHTKLYDEGHPIISDKEWDKMYFRLQYLESAYGIYDPESPTQRVNYQVVNELRKVKHNHPMLSLNKTKDWNEFLHYFTNIDPSKSVVGMLKLDGLTCSLRYVDGVLISAETRGNGVEGEDIFHNALVIKNIPKRIDYTGDLIVDGEILCDYHTFNEKFKDEYANPRNLASGSIRLLNSEECGRRELKFVLWNVIRGPYKNVMDNFNAVQKLGFTVTPWTSSFDWDAKEFLVERAKELGYPIDGLVGRFNDQVFGESLGATEHHSKAAYAFKFYDEEYETYLNDIEWTMGRTGVLTPVAIFDPVDTGDSIIERASLHNISIMKETLGIPYRGQTIQVCKMNDIIPQIISGGCEVSRADIVGLEIIPPIVCPICGGSLQVECEVDTEVLVCTNDACEGKLVNRLDHFCGKKGLDIKGLSKATLGKLLDWGWVHEPADLYTLHNFTGEWVTKPGFGAKSVENIMVAIETSRLPMLENFICALGIPHVGTALSKELVKYFKTYEEFRDAAKAHWDFTQIDGVGYEKASAIWNFDFAEADRVDDYMLGYDSLEPAAADSNLDATTVVITGKLTLHKNRDELVKRITEHGGKVTGSVSKNTHILINNDINSTSSKNVSAQRLGIPIMTEAEFVNLYLS